MSTNKRSLKQDQRGIGSLLFTLIMLIVISLIVLGFAQLARRGQREALDRQLSTQAYYAAESGVNQAAHLMNNSATTWQDADATNCNAYLNRNGVATTINNQNNVSLSCVTVNMKPSALVYDTVSTSRATVTTLNPVGGPALTALTINWRSPTGSVVDDSALANCGTNSTQLPPTANYNCPVGVLRLDLVSTGANFSDRQVLAAQTRTMFAKPISRATASRVDFASMSGTKPAGCILSNSQAICSITINVSDGSYYLRMAAIYKDISTVTIKPTGANGWANVQAVVDSTGKAQDVLRRIQARVKLPGSPSGSEPVNGALTSNQSICKKFTTMPGATSDTPGC